MVQAGHCHRKTGSIGTRSADGFTEQEFTWAVANRAVDLLRGDGFAALTIQADVPDHSYRGDAFVAIHADGSNSPSVGGASVGYRTDEGRDLAVAWKSAYGDLGWRHGFRSDNYTAALGGYYGVKRAIAQGNTRACIIEAGFLTNPAEASELSSREGQERCAQAIRAAIGATFGQPIVPESQEPEIVFTVEEAAEYVRDAYRHIAKREAKDAEVDLWSHAIASDPREMWKMQQRLVGEFLGGPT